MYLHIIFYLTMLQLHTPQRSSFHFSSFSSCWPCKKNLGLQKLKYSFNHLNMHLPQEDLFHVEKNPELLSQSCIQVTLQQNPHPI